MTAQTPRLQTQHQRLYLPAGVDGPSLVGADGRVRVLVLALAQPADWAALSVVWRGVQLDLELPAPGIAVSGGDALALWFSLLEPVSPELAGAFLAGLRQRYLPEVKPPRLRAFPGATGGLSEAAPLLPPQQTGPERWSAFVAPDLAAVFADDPALDLAPGDDAQADLLSRLVSMRPTEFQAALAQLSSLAETVAQAPAPLQAAPAAAAQHPTAAHHAGLEGPFQDPRVFLLAVMNDSSVPLAQRLQAAQALLLAAPASAPAG
jgi:hypothetical protein